jgi:hypothetical protein
MNLNQIVWLDFNYKNKHYEGKAIATLSVKNNCTREVFEIYFNNEYSSALCKHQEDGCPTCIWKKTCENNKQQAVHFSKV